MTAKLNYRAGLLVLTFFFLSCGAEEEDEATMNGVVDESDVKSAIPDMGALLIDIPSSISGSSSGSLALQDEDDEGGLENLFLLPRQFIGVSENIMDMVKEVTYHLFGKPDCLDSDTSNDPSDCDEFSGIVSGSISQTPSVFTIPEDPDDEGAPDALKYYKNASGSTYDYTFEMYWLNDSDNLYYKGMELQVTKSDEDTGKGALYLFTSSIPDLDSEDEEDGSAPGVVFASFDNTGDASTIAVKFFDMSGDDTEGEPDRMSLSLALSDGILSGAGTMIRPELSTETSGLPPFETQDEFAWIFTIAANTEEDVAVESLAFPTADNYDDSDNFFTDYGVDDIMENIVLALLRDNIESELDCSTAGLILQGSGLPNNICSDQVAVSDEAVLTGVSTFCDANASSEICTSFSPGAWSNPVYLDSDGYVGNESTNKPTDSSYDGLTDVLDTIEIIDPAALKLETAPSSGDGVTTVE